jgi:hypothetical protein
MSAVSHRTVWESASKYCFLPRASLNGGADRAEVREVARGELAVVDVPDVVANVLDRREVRLVRGDAHLVVVGGYHHLGALHAFDSLRTAAGSGELI